MLQLDPRGVQGFHQIGPVQQLEGGDGLAAQPPVQEPPDPLPRMYRIEVLRRDAERRFLDLAHFLLVGRLHRALGEDDDALEFAGLGVEGLLADADRRDQAGGQHLLGGLHGAGAILGGELQRPGGVHPPPREHFEMDLSPSHAAMIPIKA